MILKLKIGVLIIYKGISKIIIIPNSVTEIGKNVFENCSNLKLIKAPKDLNLSGTDYPKDCIIERY